MFVYSEIAVSVCCMYMYMYVFVVCIMTKLSYILKYSLLFTY